MQRRTLAVLAGVPIGLFFGSAGLQLVRASREEGRWESEVRREERAAERAQSDAKREEKAIAGFQEAIQAKQADVEHVEAEIAVCEQRLGELQELREARLKEAADAQGALEEAQGKLAKLVKEAGRHAQAALAAQAALVAAHEHVSEAKAGLTNPLQHPLVKSFRSSSH